MTDNTQPEALDLADWLEAVGGGPSAKRCAALLREQHARITALESQLAQRFDAADMATAAAQGFRDGVASVSAGSEPVATVFTMEALAPGGGVKYHATIHKPLPAGTQLYTAPQPTQPKPVAREPLTPERVKEIVRGAGYDQCGIPDTERAAFINGLRHGEHAHGIK